MGEPVRVTNPLLDVVEVLLEAFDNDRRELHGWAIMKAAARSGPTVALRNGWSFVWGRSCSSF
jgi:hypothetical protein